MFFRSRPSSKSAKPLVKGAGGKFLRSVESFPAVVGAILPCLIGVFLEEYGETGNALDRPPGIGTFDLKHEGVAGIEPGEQHLEDAIGRILFASNVDHGPALEEQDAADEFGCGSRL